MELTINTLRDGHIAQIDQTDAKQAAALFEKALGLLYEDKLQLETPNFQALHRVAAVLSAMADGAAAMVRTDIGTRQSGQDEYMQTILVRLSPEHGVDLRQLPFDPDRLQLLEVELRPGDDQASAVDAAVKYMLDLFCLDHQEWLADVHLVAPGEVLPEHVDYVTRVYTHHDDIEASRYLAPATFQFESGGQPMYFEAADWLREAEPELVLALLHGTDDDEAEIELGDWAAMHVPMIAKAVETAGIEQQFRIRIKTDLVMLWLSKHRPELLPVPTSGQPIYMLH